MTNFDRVSNWLKQCPGKDKPTIKDFSVQVGVHIEEFSEFLNEIEVLDPELQAKVKQAFNLLNEIATPLKEDGVLVNIVDRVALIDALCDTDVTGNGVAYMAGFDKNGADQEVLRSNDSKFEDGKPVILPGGKIGKGKNYSPPNLAKFANLRW